VLAEIFLLIVGYLLRVAGATLAQILILFGPILILVFITSWLASLVTIFSYQVLGMNLYLALFGWLGTSVHELGHALFCPLFAHKIKKISLFSPNRETDSLGVVIHSFNPNSLYERIGNFFIGIGPVILGPLVIFLAAQWLLEVNVADSYNQIAKIHFVFNFMGLVNLLWLLVIATFQGLGSIFNLQNLTHWQFYLFLYIAFAVGSSVRLSWSDVEGTFSGFAAIITAVFLFNFLTLWATEFSVQSFLVVIQILATFYIILGFTIILNLLALAVLWPLSIRA
jgi:hypothetical protein